MDGPRRPGLLPEPGAGALDALPDYEVAGRGPGLPPVSPGLAQRRRQVTVWGQKRDCDAVSIRHPRPTRAPGR